MELPLALVLLALLELLAWASPGLVSTLFVGFLVVSAYGIGVALVARRGTSPDGGA